jgi:hypothetical protein
MNSKVIDEYLLYAENYLKLYEEPLIIQIPKKQDESLLHSSNYNESYDTPPPSASLPSLPSSAQQQRIQHLYQEALTNESESSPPPTSTEEVETEAVKFQRMRDTPIAIKLFIDDTQIQRMLVFPIVSFKKVEDLIQVKCEKYFKRKIEIGMICYVEARNGDLVRVLKEEDWLECKYEMRRADFIRLDLIDCTDNGSLSNENSTPV